MTIDQIIASDRDTLNAADIADILECDPHTLRLMAKEDPEALRPLAPIRTGNRVKFPRQRFLWWYFGGDMREKKPPVVGAAGSGEQMKNKNV